MDDEIVIPGYERRRRWEIVYHDLIDLYGPMIGLDGIGLWITYKRFVQNNANHLLAGTAWPSHRKLATSLHVGQDTLHDLRGRLKTAGLISVRTGTELAAQTANEQCEQIMVWQLEGKPRHPVNVITLADLAGIGIQNPARMLIIEVHDPLAILPFCEKFNLTCQPEVESHDARGTPMWNMRFDDYTGIIRGDNRIAAAIHHIDDCLNARDTGITEWMIRSLLRCQASDAETISMRDHMLKRHAEIHGTLPATTDHHLPDDVQFYLKRLGWVGSVEEIERAFTADSANVYRLLTHFYSHAAEIANPAGAFREALRAEPLREEMAEIPY